MWNELYLCQNQFFGLVLTDLKITSHGYNLMIKLSINNSAIKLIVPIQSEKLIDYIVISVIVERPY